MLRTRQSSLRVLPSVIAAALVLGGGIAQVRAQGTTPSTTQTPRAEMQRGVPGVDVDLGTNGRPATNGVPGVDVDLRSRSAGNTNGVPGVDVNTSTRMSGAGAAAPGGMRPPIQDRN